MSHYAVPLKDLDLFLEAREAGEGLDIWDPAVEEPEIDIIGEER